MQSVWLKLAIHCGTPLLSKTKSERLLIVCKKFCLYKTFILTKTGFSPQHIRSRLNNCLNLNVWKRDSWSQNGGPRRVKVQNSPLGTVGKRCAACRGHRIIRYNSTRLNFHFRGKIKYCIRCAPTTKRKRNPTENLF